MAKDLDKLIKDLKKMTNNFDKMFSKQYDYIMARLLVLIGSHTAYDTGQARQVIKNVLIELGYAEYESEIECLVYEFWKTVAEREEEVDYVFVKTNNRYKLIIDDYGTANQNDGVVSDKHPRNDKQVIPYHIDMALDMLETGANTDLNNAFTRLEDAICNMIEKGVRF